jgi:hypothetical protein
VHRALKIVLTLALVVLAISVGVTPSSASASRRCGHFFAAGETVASTRWNVTARNVSCRTAFPVVRRFTRTGKVAFGWRCVGQDVSSACSNGRWHVRATASQ